MGAKKDGNKLAPKLTLSAIGRRFEDFKQQNKKKEKRHLLVDWMKQN